MEGEAGGADTVKKWDGEPTRGSPCHTAEPRLHRKGRITGDMRK